MVVEMSPGRASAEGEDAALPGRLGDPERTLGTDPRADPRMLAALAAFGLDQRAEAPPVTPSAPREEQLAFCAAAEAGFEAVFAALHTGLPPMEGVTSATVPIAGDGGHEIQLYVHRPAGATGTLPCIVHLHGGGMVILQAAGAGFRRWRDELAVTGMVVVGVEYRNGAGQLGVHPFPSGLDDCAVALRWVCDHREELGVDKVVVSGESGGGNLTLAVTLRAKREGWVDEIAGVYAQCPYISNAWATMPADLPSLHENDGYFLSCDVMAVMAEVYDPGGDHAEDPTCWPYRATVADLEGLPPHVISVNELDPLRDEGLAYYRRLLEAGVSAVSRTVNGTCHAGDAIFRVAMPDVYAATIRDLAGFVAALPSPAGP
jgi:acetyl esterase/lipase